MNIFTRIKNNLEYYRYSKLSDKALVEMQKHLNDADDTEFKMWGNIGLLAFKKCMEIPLK